MREIKFRGKRLDNGQWMYGDLNHDCNGKALINTEGYSAYGTGVHYRYLVSSGTVGQFTGLHDKNGTEIYEGDLMPIYENGNEYIYKVLYDGDCFMLGFIDSEQGTYPLSTKCNISEVIGNIHDNKELTTDKK